MAGKIEVYIDGACGPVNPGGTGSYGVYLKYEDAVHEDWGIIGEGETMSCNVAEYAALLNALLFIDKKWGTDQDIEVYSDSQLVVNQMNRKWQIKSGF